jgi:hypothetical protein
MSKQGKPKKKRTKPKAETKETAKTVDDPKKSSSVNFPGESW